MALLSKSTGWIRRVRALFFPAKCSGEWEEKELPEIAGKYSEIIVRCHPFPVKQKNDCSCRKCIYPDFGSDFRHELMDVQMADWELLKTELEQGKRKTVHVKLSKCNEITVSVDCQRVPLSKQQLFSDMADAIIDAMKRNSIQPS